MKLPPLTGLPYHNCKVLNPDGELMFRCSTKIIDWYLSRGLATPINALTIKLNFIPNGPGHIGEKFFLAEKENICVVCGSAERLTKHHVVPKCYRKYFPPKIKNHSSYDVLILCVNCHEQYEPQGFQLKITLAEEVGITVGGIRNIASLQLRSIARTILRLRAGVASVSNRRTRIKFPPHKKEIPAERLEFHMNKLREQYGQEITDDILTELAQDDKSDYAFYGKYVVEHLTDINAFMHRWRQHFVTTMSPKFLPIGWES